MGHDSGACFGDFEGYDSRCLYSGSPENFEPAKKIHKIKPEKDRFHFKPERVDVVLVMLLDKHVIGFFPLHILSRAPHSEGSLSASWLAISCPGLCECRA